jgi:hypothetical protein
MSTREDMIRATPAIAQAWARDTTGASQKWIGAWCLVLLPSTPVDIRRMAADLHNKRTHNTRTSTFVDLVRSMQTTALDNYDRCKAGFVAAGFPHRIPTVSAYSLNPDQVYQAYSQSGYDPGDRLQRATSLQTADYEVHGFGMVGRVVGAMRGAHATNPLLHGHQPLTCICSSDEEPQGAERGSGEVRVQLRHTGEPLAGYHRAGQP